MARIKRTVKVELTDEEKEILYKASKILDELAEEDGADDLYEIMTDNYDTGLYFISCALDNLIENSN
jgi:hypothetical protein